MKKLANNTDGCNRICQQNGEKSGADIVHRNKQFQVLHLTGQDDIKPGSHLSATQTPIVCKQEK